MRLQKQFYYIYLCKYNNKIRRHRIIIRMENFRKIKQLAEKKYQKAYARTELQARKSKIIKENTQKQMLNSVLQPELDIDNSQESEEQIFFIKNLDSNKVQVYRGEKNVEEQLLADIDELPEIERLLQIIWQKYMTELEKQEQEFLQACYQGDVKRVMSVVSGKNKHPIDPRTALTDEGKNGIHLATISGSYRNTEIISVLVDYKVDIDGRTRQQLRTPLMLGSILGNDVAVKALIKLGANMKLQDYEGNTAMHLACIFNQQAIVQVLVESNFPLGIKNNKEMSPIECITNPRILELVKCDSEYSRTIFKEASLVLPNSRIDHVQRLLAKREEQQQQLQQTESSNSRRVGQTGKTANQVRQEKIKQIVIKEIKSINLSSFRKISMLGRGAFGEVYLVQNGNDGKRYAMKVLDKGSIMRQNILRYAMTQRQILSTINHPFIVHLHFAFQTAEKLFLVMDYCPGGDLLNLIKKRGKLQEQTAKKYVAEIVLAIQALHRAEIIYRDLKPSNIIIDENGHALLTDFGLSKEASLSHSFCGSTAYLAPEMLWRRGHTKVLDWYLMGVLIYQILTGKPPFWDSNKEQLLANIKSGRYKHLGTQFSKEVRDLVEKVNLCLCEGIKVNIFKLLRSNSNKRLGINGSKEVKSHAWFSDLSWEQVQGKRMKMEVLQQVKGRPIKQEQFQSSLGENQSNQIKGWDYIPA